MNPKINHLPTELTAKNHSAKQERKLQKDISNGEKKIIKTILKKEDEIKKLSDLAELFKVKSDADLIRKLIYEIDKIQNLLTPEFRKDNKFPPSVMVKKILERHKNEISESEKERAKIFDAISDDSLADVTEYSYTKSKNNKTAIEKSEKIIYSYRRSLSSKHKRNNSEIKIINILTQFFLIDEYLDANFDSDYKNSSNITHLKEFQNNPLIDNNERKNIDVVYDEVKRYLCELTFVEDVVERCDSYNNVRVLDKFDTDKLLDFVFENIESVSGSYIQKTTFERRWQDKIDGLFKETHPLDLLGKYNHY
ncbi:MAG: hypothetical protein QM504_01065 [Pseudomonadota bacterium]